MANYAKQIKLDENSRANLISYIEDELSRHYSERGDMIKLIESYQVDYNAEPSVSEGTWPFKGAATIIIPIAAITVEAIHARVITTMFAMDQFVTAKPVNKKYQDHARPVERFLDTELLDRIGVKKSINDALLEVTKYGTGIIKTGYCKIVKTAVRENAKGENEDYEYVVRANATVDAVPLSRFLMPFVYQNPQDSSWCGEEHEYTAYEVRLHEISGMFSEGTMEKLNTYFTSPPSEGNSGRGFQENQEQTEGTKPLWPTTIPVQELYLGFDVEGAEELVNTGTLEREKFPEGFDKEIVVFIHRPSQTILSCTYNQNEDLRRPYDTGVYFPVEHRWRGIGVCKQVEQFQKEITTQHRQRIDNATIANCRMIKISKLSDYGPNEPIFPGKIWFVDNVDEIESFSLGEIYSSSYSNESSSLQYVQQRTGVNEVNLGMPQVGTPGTATSDLARIQEGNKKFDFTYRNNRDFINSVLNKTILNIKQYGTRAATYYTLVDGGDKAKEFFELDYEILKHDLALKINVAGQQDNKLLDRQNMQQIVQFLTQYHEGMISLSQAVNDPALTQSIARNGMYSATEAMRQILETFDIKNIDRIIYQEALADGFTKATGGGISGPPPAPAPTGMEPPPTPYQ